MTLIPSREQWRKWSLISRASYVGAVVGVLALILTIALPYWSNNNGGSYSKVNVRQTSSGPQSPNVIGIGGDATVTYGSNAAESPKLPQEKK